MTVPSRNVDIEFATEPNRMKIWYGAKVYRYSFHTLQLLASVAETRSFARTAALANLTPSAVSKRIAELEHQLRVRLLVRLPHGVELTNAGGAVVRCASDMLSRLSIMSQELIDVAHGEAGHVNVMTNSTGILLGLVEDLKAFRMDHPMVEIKLHEGMSRDVVDAVEDGRADIGVCSQETPLRGLTSLDYRETPLVIALPDNHALAHRANLQYQETVGYPHIGRPEGSALAFVPNNEPSKARQFEGLQSSVRSFDAVIELVRARVGIGILPRAAFDQRQTSGIISVPLSDEWARFRLSIVHDAMKTSNPSAILLLHWLNAKAAG